MSDTATKSLRAIVLAPTSRRLFALPVLMTGTFMVTLDFFIVNVALPAMQREFNAGSAAIEWIVAGYGLAYAALLITGGRLGDLHGRRRVFVIGMGLFTLASAGCGMAPNASWLVIGRVAQGIGAAILVPQVLAIIGVLYTGRDRARAFAAYGVVLGLASACGQVIGGALIAADFLGLGWRTCFLVNAPLGAAALAFVTLAVPESRAVGPHRLDLAGAALLTASIAAVLPALIEGPVHGWPAWAWLCFAAAAILFMNFVRQQRRCAAPLIDPSLFRAPGFGAGICAVVALFGGVASFFLVLALYLQRGIGLAPLPSGLVFSSMGLGFSLTSLAAGRITRQFGRQLLQIGAFGMVVGLLALRLVVGWYGVIPPLWILTATLMLDGAGTGLVVAPLTATVLAELPAHHAGSAAGVLSTAQQLANAIGVALIGVVFFATLGDGDFAAAFGASLVYLIALAAGLTCLVSRLTHCDRV